jgi:predicted dehydrogenase
MKKIKGIIVGTGRAGTYLHLGAHLSAGVEILAFIDSDIDKARNTSKIYSVPYSYKTIEEACTQHPEIDFVDICTPSSIHFENIMSSIKFTKHILVEKPITQNLDELNSLKNIALNYPKQISAVHNHKFYPGINMAIELINQSYVGKIIHVHREMSFIHDKARMLEKEHWSHSIPGGRLFEANPHNLYLLFCILGEFELININPQKSGLFPPHIKIDSFLSTFKSKTGATATLKMSLNYESSDTRSTKHGPNFILVSGSKNTILFNYESLYVLRNNIWEKINNQSTFSRIVNRLTSISKNESLKINGLTLNTGKSSGHYWLIDKFISNIRDNRNDCVPLDEAYFVQDMNFQMGKKVEEYYQH